MYLSMTVFNVNRSNYQRPFQIVVARGKDKILQSLISHYVAFRFKTMKGYLKYPIFSFKSMILGKSVLFKQVVYK